MRALKRIPAVVLIPAGLFASIAAVAEVPWSGPGWYVEGSVSGMDITLISGPYASEDECKSRQPADEETYHYVCSYETSDPTDDGPPARAQP